MVLITFSSSINQELTTTSAVVNASPNTARNPADKQLNVLLKGKRLKTAPLAAILPSTKKLSTARKPPNDEYSYNIVMSNDDNNDEGIIDDNDDDEEEDDVLYNSDTEEINTLYPTYNTPATIRMTTTTTANELTAMATRGEVVTSYENDEMIEFTTTMMMTTELRTTRALAAPISEQRRVPVKPAILPALGTTSCARMTERPKPAKKYKTVLLPSEMRPETGLILPAGPKHVNSPNLDDEFSSQVSLSH